MDACNAVMHRINKPKGLIRYASERTIAEGSPLKVNARVIFYSVILTGLLLLVAYLFSVRTDVEATVLRMSGSMYQEYDSVHYSNIYTIQVVNKTRKELPVRLELVKPEGDIKMMGDSLIVRKGQLGTANFLVVVRKDQIKTSDTKVIFRVLSGDREIQKVKSTFVGPNALDYHQTDHK